MSVVKIYPLKATIFAHAVPDKPKIKSKTDIRIKKIDLNKVSLRKAKNSDIEILIENRIDFLKEVQTNPGENIIQILRNNLHRYLSESLENGSFISWIAEYENKPVGFSGMVIREQPGCFQMPYGKVGYILNMYTLKKYRKNGIGTLLLQKLLDEASELDLDRIDLHATRDGEPIYRRFGFVDTYDKVLEKILH